MGVILVLAMAILSVPSLAQGIAGNGGVDILGRDGGIFETNGAAFRFPEQTDINVDTLTVGNDRALAFGGLFPGMAFNCHEQLGDKEESGLWRMRLLSGT